MARIIGRMSPDNKDQFAPLAEYYSDVVSLVYEVVGERLLRDLVEKPDTLQRSGAFLIELEETDRRIIHFPYAIADVVSVTEA